MNLSTVVCRQCGNCAEVWHPENNWRIEGSPTVFQYGECKACNLLFCTPFPSAEELGRYYDREFDYSWYTKRSWLKRAQASHRWLRTKEFLRSANRRRGRLLDIGCGHGWFLDAARRDGWEVWGVDLPSAASRHAREVLRLRVLESGIERAELPAQEFDVITMWHALEHMPEPNVAVEQVLRWLKPSGWLVIAVPNKEALGVQARGAEWVWIQQPFVHLWHFSSASLRALLEKANMTVERCQTYDTWDALASYDIRREQKFVRVWRALADGIATVVGFFSARRKNALREGLFFYLSESTRIVFYAVYLVCGRFLGSSLPTAGSELLVYATPRSSH
jgi:SAM-dependent methyltransferase